MQQLFHPDFMKKMISQNLHPVIFDQKMRQFARVPMAREALMGSEWSHYIRLVTVRDGNKDGPFVGEGMSLGEWWAARAKDFPSLYLIANHLLCMSVSAAGIERAHKVVSQALPSNNSREGLSNENLRYEIFFNYNQNLIDVWGDKKRKQKKDTEKAKEKDMELSDSDSD